MLMEVFKNVCLRKKQFKRHKAYWKKEFAEKNPFTLESNHYPDLPFYGYKTTGGTQDYHHYFWINNVFMKYDNHICSHAGRDIDIFGALTPNFTKYEKMKEMRVFAGLVKELGIREVPDLLGHYVARGVQQMNWSRLRRGTRRTDIRRCLKYMSELSQKTP